MKASSFIFFLFLVACSAREKDTVPLKTKLILYPAESLSTRAGNPDEGRISDYNIFVFNAFGDLEEHVYVPSRVLQAQGGTLQYETTLLRGVPYTVLAAANLGYELPIHNLADARSYRYYMTYPDEYSRGMPMAAVLEDVLPGEVMHLPLQRLMARIDIGLDRSALEEGRLVRITALEVEACPSSVSLFPGSQARETFLRGFSKSGEEVMALNRPGNGVVSLYVLENCPASAPAVRILLRADEGTRHLSYSIPVEELRRNTVYPITIRLTP